MHRLLLFGVEFGLLFLIGYFCDMESENRFNDLGFLHFVFLVYLCSMDWEFDSEIKEKI